MHLPVHRIIPFSNVEGLGNRTSIFVKGCNANCLYCHNAETIPMAAQGIARYTVDELMTIIQSHMPFIRGITVSGGEATLYHEFLTKLFDSVHSLNLSCYVDTNGFFDLEQIGALVEATDKFLYDIKGLGPDLNQLCFSDKFLLKDHRVKDYRPRFTLGQEHLKNLATLLEKDKVEEIRLVYVKGYYDEEQVITTIAKALKPYPNIPLKLIRMHLRGLPKERISSLKGAIPSKADFVKLQGYAQAKGIQNILPIL